MLSKPLKGVEFPVRLIVISPEAEDARELAVLAELFGAGLMHYHLRKPGWDRVQLAAWLRALPASLHGRVLLHTHHDLASEFSLGGLHDRDQPSRQVCHPIGDTLTSGLLLSRAVHALSSLRVFFNSYDRLLLSPVFPSLSKPGHGSAADFDWRELQSILDLPRRAEVIALGGIDVARVPACQELGFDGVAVLGAIWQADEPLRVFNQLQDVLHAHAA